MNKVFLLPGMPALQKLKSRESENLGRVAEWPVVCVRKVHTLDPHTTWLLDRDKSRSRPAITVTVALSEFLQRMNARGA